MDYSWNEPEPLLSSVHAPVLSHHIRPRGLSAIGVPMTGKCISPASTFPRALDSYTKCLLYIDARCVICSSK